MSVEIITDPNKKVMQPNGKLVDPSDSETTKTNLVQRVKEIRKMVQKLEELEVVTNETMKLEFTI